MSAALTYGDGERVEIGDLVELPAERFDRARGRVINRFPRSQRAMVRWEDHWDTNKSGEPKSKTASVPTTDLELIARDG